MLWNRFIQYLQVNFLSSSNKTLTKNTLLLFIGQITNGLFGILLLSILAKHIRVDQFGVFTLAITTAEMFIVFADFGISYMTVKEVAQSDPYGLSFIVPLLVLKVLLVIFAFLLIGGVTRFLYSTTVFVAIVVACSAWVFKTFRIFVSSIFNGRERMEYTALTSIVYSVFSFLGILAILFLINKDVPILLVGYIFGGCVSLLLSVYYLNRMARISINKITLIDIRSWFKKSLPFGIFFMGTFFYFQVDNFILNKFHGEESIALYQAAFRILLAIELFSMSLSNAVYPKISKIVVEYPSKAKRLVLKMICLVFLFFLPIGFFLIIFARPVITILYSENFEPSITILRILAMMIPIRAMAQILGVSLSSTNGQHLRVYSVFCAAVFNIVLNLIFIPKYSYLASAVISVLTSSFLFFIYSILLHKHFGYLIKKEKLLTNAKTA